MNKQVFEFELTRLLQSKSLFMFILILAVLDIFVFTVSRYVLDTSNFFNEISSVAKVALLSITFYTSLRSFRLLSSGMAENLVCSIRSKQATFFTIITFQVFLSLVMFTFIVPSIVYAFDSRDFTSAIIPVEISLTLGEFLARCLLFLLLASSMSLLFQFYFKRTINFLLAIYLIPQLILIITKVESSFSRLSFIQKNPFNMLNEMLRIAPTFSDYLLIGLFTVISIALSRFIFLRE